MRARDAASRSRGLCWRLERKLGDWSGSLAIGAEARKVFVLPLADLEQQTKTLLINQNVPTVPLYGHRKHAGPLDGQNSGPVVRLADRMLAAAREIAAKFIRDNGGSLPTGMAFGEPCNRVSPQLEHDSP